MQDHVLLRLWRKQFGWTQKDIAEQLDKTVRTISNWESGKYEIPNIYIAKRLGLTLEDYLAGPEKYGKNSVNTIGGLQAIPEREKRTTFVPKSMISVYCLSKIDRDFMHTEYEGFTPPMRIFPNNVDFCRLIVDQKVPKEIPDRVIVNKNPGDDEYYYYLIWDGNQADIIPRSKLNRKSKVLGAIFL